MKKYSVPTYFFLFLIGAVALWYFGHHRPAQEILKAEPKKVYRTKLPDTLKLSQRSEESTTRSHTEEKSNSRNSMGSSKQGNITTDLHRQTALSEKDINASYEQMKSHHNFPTQKKVASEDEKQKMRKAEMDAKREENLAFLREGKNNLMRMLSEAAHFLSTQSLEEQRNILNALKTMVFTETPRLYPGEDTPEELGDLWNDFLTMLEGAGYTLPEGVDFE
ncbi:MAG: hypothetical protein OXM61_03555 [Candidatus Poribacteria bacterium]|nr:hypothetical protein [Candidatus Poribacteria bacterium]